MARLTIATGVTIKMKSRVSIILDISQLRTTEKFHHIKANGLIKNGKINTVNSSITEMYWQTGVL